MWSTGETILYVDYNDIPDFSSKLTNALVNDPDHVLDDFLDAFKDVLREGFPSDFDEIAKYDSEYRVRFHAKKLLLPIPQCRHDVVLKFVTLTGLVIRVSPPKLQCVTATFECQDCGHQFEINQYATVLIKPMKCMNPGCKNKNRFIFVEKDSTFNDWQYLTIQERPDEIKGTHQPREMKIIVLDELVDKAAVGDVIQVTGTFYSNFEDRNNVKSNIAHLFLVTNSLELVNAEACDTKMTDDEILTWKQRALEPDFLGNLIKSISPTTLGMEEYRFALALAMAGGVSAETPDKSKAFRGDIHIGFMGDPSTNKSTLLKYGKRVIPRSQYGNGKGITGVGLTAAVTRDPETGEFAIAAGLLPRASGYLAFIDEFNLMSDEDKASLSESMEDQTAHIAKAGLVANYTIKCGLIWAGNPKEGRWQDHLPAVKNINIPTQILSRNDLLFIVHDKPDHARDQAINQRIYLAREMAKNPTIPQNNETGLTPPYSLEELQKYFAYVRTLRPTIPENVWNKLNEFYLKMRPMREGNPAIGMDTRQFEGLLRLTEACAKLRLSDVATIDDATKILDLKTKSLQDIGYDALTGEIDIDKLLTGKTTSQRKLENTVLDLVKRIQIEQKNNPVDFEDIYDNAHVDDQLGILSKEGIENLLLELKRTGKLGIIENKEKKTKHVKIFGLVFPSTAPIVLNVSPTPILPLLDNNSPKHVGKEFWYEEITDKPLPMAEAEKLQETKYGYSKEGYDFFDYNVEKIGTKYKTTWKSSDNCE